MSSGATITIKDTGWSLIEDLESLECELQAGVLEGANAHEKIGTADLALIHEDGAPRAKIRARPFMRPTFDQNVDAYGDEVERIAEAAVRSNPTGKMLADLADTMAEDMRDTILQGKTGGPSLKPISPSRMAERRQGLTPLVDSGALVESLQGQVVPGGVGG
jgi:hypothetical protein